MLATYICITCRADKTPDQVRADGFGHYLCPLGHGVAGPLTSRSTPLRGFWAGVGWAAAISAASPLMSIAKHGSAQPEDAPVIAAIVAAVLAFVSVLYRWEARRLERSTDAGKRLARYHAASSNGVAAFLPFGCALAGLLFRSCLR
jgi:hypothetical protein